MLESFRLRVFREVARHRSFRRAAEALYITQPAVTQHIKALETEVGSALFDRGSGGVRLTAAGETLLLSADESARALEVGMIAVAAIRGELRGKLQLAASTTIAQYILPGVLGDFLRTHSTIELALQSANTAAVVQAVVDGNAALGLIEGPAHRAQILATPWLEDELVLVVPPDHLWANRTIKLQELTEVSLLLRESGSGTREVLEEALLKAGAPLKRSRMQMELGSTETLLACIEARLGVGFASKFAIQRQLRLKSLTMVKVQGLRVRRTLSVIQSRAPERRGPAAAFAEALQLFARAVRREERARRR